MQTERELILGRVKHSIRFKPLSEPERFEEGEVTVYVYTPMSIDEYRALGQDMRDFLRERGVRACIDVTNTADMFFTDIDFIVTRLSDKEVVI